MSIKGWVILLVNFFIYLVVLILTFFFYQEFRNALNERVLLQLSSVQTLKRGQIESLLEEKWNEFLQKDESQSIKSSEFEKYILDRSSIDSVFNLNEGIHDLSHLGCRGDILLLFVKMNNGRVYREICVPEKIQEILLERTGMGQSGETYIVGTDFRLRSESRFFPDKNPRDIIVRTKGVNEAILGKSGKGIFNDYREKEVYSVYHPLRQSFFTWIVLSEIDVVEVTEPLANMKKKLIYIALILIAFVAVVSYFMINKITVPITKVSDLLRQMGKGQYEIEITPIGFGIEVRQLYDSLLDLQKSLMGATAFSNQLGTMDLQTEYSPAGEYDTLGYSLMAMREKLKGYQETEIQNQIVAKQLLIRGQENERRRLSKELHDGIGPLLTSLKLMLQSSELEESKKEELKNFINQTIQAVRQISNDLMPASLLDFGVAQAVSHWITILQKSTDIHIEFDSEMNEDAEPYDKQVDIGLYRIIQELVNNGLKHAEAHNIRLSLTQFDDKISLFYCDDGIGFDNSGKSEGAGLKNCKERTEILNGYFSVNSRKGSTQIEVEIPI